MYTKKKRGGGCFGEKLSKSFVFGNYSELVSRSLYHLELVSSSCCLFLTLLILMLTLMSHTFTPISQSVH